VIDFSNVLDTIEDELCVASFLVNYFKRGPFLDTCGCVPLLGRTPKVPLMGHYRAEPILAYCTTILYLNDIQEHIAVSERILFRLWSIHDSSIPFQNVYDIGMISNSEVKA
jgi:hypothetical protein